LFSTNSIGFLVHLYRNGLFRKRIAATEWDAPWNRDIEMQSRGFRKLTNPEPDPAGFKQTDKNSHGEVKVLDDGVADRSRKIDASTAEKAVKHTLLLHDLGGQRSMENGDQHTQEQSYDFYGH